MGDTSQDKLEKRLVTDVVNAVDEMQQTFKRLQDRELGNKQRNMILLQSMNQITTYWNNLHSTRIENDEFFVQAMDDIAYKIRKMMNKLPHNEDYDSFRFRLQGLYNFCYILISFRTGEKAMFKMQGVANILANVLMGVVPLEKLELPSIENPQFIDILERNITYLFSTSLMLISVIDGSPTIDRESLISWIRSIYQFNDQLHQLTSDLPLRVIYNKFYSRSESQFYLNLEIINQWQFHFISATALVQQLLGTELESIVNTSLLDSGVDPIFSAITRINDLRQKLADKLQEMFDQGVISANHPPSKSKELQYSRNFLLFDNIRKSRYQLFKSASRGQSVGENEIDQAIKDGKLILKRLEDAKEDSTIMFKPEDITYYLDNFKEVMVLMLLKYREDNTYNLFENELDSLIKEANLFDQDNYPEIELLEIILKLDCCSGLKEYEMMDSLLTKLRSLMQKIEYNNQMYSTGLLLELLIELDHSPSTDLVDNKFLLIKSKLSSGFGHMMEDVSTYQMYLNNKLEDKDSLRPPMIPINYLDYFSWIRPKFRVEGKLIPYIPLNLISQKIT